MADTEHGETSTNVNVATSGDLESNGRTFSGVVDKAVNSTDSSSEDSSDLDDKHGTDSVSQGMKN